MIVRKLVQQEHYLHSLPRGTCLAFGVFLEGRLMGALTLGVGPYNAPSLVEGASSDDCLTLTRMWLSDELPGNSESRALGMVVRALRKHTSLKFLVTYADPDQGHVGTIYQASNWFYIGLSEAPPQYDFGDGKIHHSRSLSHAYGTHSLRHFARYGVDVKVVPQSSKYRYLYLLDQTWRSRVRAPFLPYPKSNGVQITSKEET